MLRFLLTPRWLGLLLVVVVVGVACVELGNWQFRRYGDAKSDNRVVERNLRAAPTDAARVFNHRQLPSAREWRTVRASGRYDNDRSVIVLYSIRDGRPGVELVVPLVMPDGTAVLVDRGWVPTAANASTHPKVPSPPQGPVTVTGWARADSDSTDAGEVDPMQGTVRAISSDAISRTFPYPVLNGFVDATSETPAPAKAPRRAVPPDLGTGPHLFYGIQWYFFAMLAFGFWLYFGWAEYRERSGRTVRTPAVRPTGAPHHRPEAPPR